MSKSTYLKKPSLQDIKRTSSIDTLLQKDLQKYNPTLKSILKVERLFKENIEFGSKNQILRKLGGTMKAPVLNVILKYLKEIGKIIDNQDGSWTWIYAAHNRKLKKSYRQASRL
ncbi:MAG: hypothetical protein ACT4N5_06380 [Nitrosopumilaceae archaeon]